MPEDRGIIDGSTGISLDTGSQGNLLSRNKKNKYSSAYVPHNRLSRYTTALYNLVPVRFKRVPGSEIPIDKIGLFSSVSLGWLSEYVSAGFKNRMSDRSFPTLGNLETCQVNGPRIDSLWHAHVVEQGQAGASLPKIAWDFVKTRLLVGSFIYLLGMIISLTSPILILQHIIARTEKMMNLSQNSTTISPILNTTKPSIDQNTTKLIEKSIIDFNNHEIMIDKIVFFTEISILIVAELLSCFLIAWSSSMNLRTATRLRSACLALTYKKLIRSSVRYKAPVHQTLTYFVPDSSTLYDLLDNGPLIFSGPLILLLCSLFIWRHMGHWALVGIIFLIIFYFGLIFSAYLTKLFATKAMKYSLQRITLLQELISKISLAKIGKYDKKFLSQMQFIRNKELNEMKYGAFIESLSLSMVHIIPIITVIVTTLAYVFTQKQIISAHYVPCLVLILLNLKHCIRSSWMAMSSISRGIASLNNLKTILILKDAHRYTEKPIDKNLSIAINNGHFSWDQDKSPTETIIRRSSQFVFSSSQEGIPSVQLSKLTQPNVLSDVNFYAQKGKIIGICGPTGSGKSSLLLTIMGQLNHVSGHVAIDGSCSYVPEDPWLFEGTLKENIIMGETLNASWYYKTIQASNMSKDLCFLPGSDDTDISIVDLTNSQKQKIAFARAIYTSKDINLFDNPLRDVELNEALEIFEKSIKLLEGKTIIIVTNKIKFLRKCDTISLLNNGKILKTGDYHEIMEMGNDFIELIENFDRKNSIDVDGKIQSILESSINSNEINNFNDDSCQDDNECDCDNYNYKNNHDFLTKIEFKYFFGGGIFSKFICCLAFFYSFPIAGAPLIFIYIDQKTLTGTTEISVILGSLLGFTIFWGLTLIIMYNKDVFTAAKKIHETWLKKIYRAQISSFSMKSSSILMNIFSLSIQEIDYVLPKLKITVLMNFGISVLSAMILGILSPWLLIPVILFIILSLSYNFYIRGLLLTLYELKINSILPIYKHTVNTIKERAVIQTYGKEREFSKKFYKYCNESSAYDFMLNGVKLWIEFRIKFLSIINLAIIMIICATQSKVKDRYEDVGLAFILSLQMTKSIVYLTEAVVNIYGSLLNIGIADEFILNLPRENIEGTSRLDWPQRPSIHFQNVLLTNSPNLDQQPLNLSIIQNNDESGATITLNNLDNKFKKNLIKALLQFREVYSGSILIGSQNIENINVDIFRNYVDYLPESVALFEGSIRYNLDRDCQMPDKDLINILQKIQLWDKISSLDGKLNHDAGNLFNCLEKKLIILARIYLNSSNQTRHIIIVEDLGPDEKKIQEILTNIFSNFTIILLSRK